MKIQLVNLHRNYSSIKNSVQKEIKHVLNSSSFIKGSYLESFEKSFAKFIGTKYCIGVASGTDALYISLRALGLRKGDEVIVPVNTFVAAVYAVLFVGANPILVDIDEATHNINLSLIKKAITKKTKAIIPTHLYGSSVDMDAIKKIAKKYHLLVIEDACQAHGATFKKSRLGSIGDIATFSFYPSKNLGAYGDGGAITTNSKKFADACKSIREYGSKTKYIYDLIGINSRLDSIQAAILSVKLKNLDKWNKKRNRLATYYTKKFVKELPFIKLQKNLPNSFPIYHLYVIRSPKRNKLMNYLLECGIQTGIHYPIPLHLQKSLQFLGYKEGDFPISERVSNEILSIPIYPELKKSEQDYIVHSIKSFFGK